MKQRRTPCSLRLEEYRHTSADALIGILANAQFGDVKEDQLRAWRSQYALLLSSTNTLSSGTVCFEYVIPRLGKRADNVLIVGNTVLVLEFKVGAQSHYTTDVSQVMDYALDLKNFHAESSHSTLVPILVATEAPDKPFSVRVSEDGVSEVILANSSTLASCIKFAVDLGKGALIDPDKWLNGEYRPTPTIIEASQAMMRGHKVSEIAHSEASSDNLGATASTLTSIINETRTNKTKCICFLTGVQGSGKTLAGLNLASEQRRADIDDPAHAVFLSGNGPLVKVLQEALARDAVDQAKLYGSRLAKKTHYERLLRSFKTFTTSDLST